MRKVDENRAENYIKRHRNNKRWLAFAIAVSVITGTGTLYMLNKPATAMTQDGARKIGLVLETADSQFEQGLIEKMNLAASISGAIDGGDGQDAGESTGKTWEDIVEKLPEGDKKDETPAQEPDNSGAGSSENVDESQKPSDAASTESSDDKASDKDGATEDNSGASSSGASGDTSGTASSGASGDAASKDGSNKDGGNSKDGASTASSGASNGASNAASKDSSSESSSDASSASSSDASSSASSSAPDKKEEKVPEAAKDIVLIANYIDRNGEKIADSDSFTIPVSEDGRYKVLDFTKNYKEFGGYYYLRAMIGGNKIASITANKKSENDSDDSAATESSVDEVKQEYVYYIATTTDGQTITLESDTEITFVYAKANSQKDFSYQNKEVTVRINLSDPEILPEGVDLKVVTLDKDTEGYNYDAYLDALNKNADKIAKESGEDTPQKYDDNNTVLFDIAFMLDDIEYELKDGTAAVSVIFNQKQISDTFGTTASSDVAIVHLPVSDDVMQEVDSTSDATDITSRDISVEILTDGNIDLGNGVDVLSFETGSFSVYGTVKTWSATTWQGDQYYGARDIVKMLGDATYFGVVANEYDGNNNHSEANIAVGKISNIQNFTIGNSTQVYTAIDTYKVTVSKTVSGSPKAGKFYFAVFADKEGKNKIQGSDFTITTGYDGKGSYTFDAAPYQKGGNTYSRLYVYELDREGGQAVPGGAKVGNYTVTYGTDSFEGLNDSVSLFTDNYIENMNGYTGEFVLQKVDGATVYYKTSDSSYASVQYNQGSYKKDVFTGTFPVDIHSMISNAEETASRLAYANTTNDVVVVNIVGTQGGYLQSDLTSKYFRARYNNVPDNYAVNTGFTIGEDTLLLINVDLTGVSEYTFDKITVNGEGTGDWSKIANQIVLNPVQRDAMNDYHPYSGKLITNIASGALVAPKAKVSLYSSYSGTIIADTVDKKCEIHKITVRKFLDAQAAVDIYNASSNSEIIKIEADKYIDGNLAKDADSGKFKFTFGMFDPVEKVWKQLDTNITNVGSKITYDLYPEKLGMEYGDGSSQDNMNAHTYYFMLTENDLDSSKYSKDTTGILIKIKYYEGGEKEPLYYRVTETEYWSNIWNNTTSYFDDNHRIKVNRKTSEENLKNVAFYNKIAETVDIVVTKAWVLNGRDKSDIPSNTDDVVLTLYQASGGKTVEVDAKYKVKKEKKPSVDGADVTWTYTWTKLPKYDANGNRITYTVAESSELKGFKSDTPVTNPRLVVFTDGEQVSGSGSTALGTATITNKGASLKLVLHKYLDNQTPTEKFDFVIRQKSWDGSKWKWVNYDKSLETSPISNDGDLITYTIDPSLWKMQPGKNSTYYFRMEEVAYKNDTNRNNKSNTPNYPNYKRDNGVILIKVVYTSENDIDITYYKVDRNIGKQIIENCTLVDEYCNSQYQVTGDKVAFYNSTTDDITITVTKVWDELVGRAKNDKAVADSIWDVTFRLMRSTDEVNWEVAEEYTIKAPRIWQDFEGADFKGELNDYPEDWTFDSNEGGYISKTITFNNLSKNYKYKIQEYYVDANGNYNELTVKGQTVNGFKLESIKRTDDKAGNIDFKLHNTPYIQIYKYWKFNGNDVSGEDTKDYNPVYVKLLRNYRNDKGYVQLTESELKAAATNPSLVHNTPNGAVIELNYANNWFAEFALDRKQDNEDGQAHVFQYVYFIRECDVNGVDREDSPYITYGSININNVTRTTADYNYDRGFKDKIKGDEIHWENAWASGNNYPVCILNVTNNRGSNVLPHSGGIGETPFKVAGAVVIFIAILGGLVFFTRKKKGFEA